MSPALRYRGLNEALLTCRPPEALLSLIRRPICELSFPGLELAQRLEASTAYTSRMTLYSC
jgi:hypothetical protein